MQRNTYKNGKLTLLVWETPEGAYVAACPELCLLAEEKDCEQAEMRLLRNAKHYLNNVIENRLGEHLLNQNLPDEIEEEYNALLLRRSVKVLVELSQEVVRNAKRKRLSPA